MLTRIPVATKESLKALAANPEYGNLRKMFELLFDKFLSERPYKQSGFIWIQPDRKDTPGWIAFNVVVSDESQNKIKEESSRLEVSLTTLLYTAILWWIEINKRANRF